MQLHDNLGYDTTLIMTSVAWILNINIKAEALKSPKSKYAFKTIQICFEYLVKVLQVIKSYFSVTFY